MRRCGCTQLCRASWFQSYCLVMRSKKLTDAPLAKQALSSVMEFKVSDVPHDGRHTTCTDGLYMRGSSLRCSQEGVQHLALCGQWLKESSSGGFFVFFLSSPVCVLSITRYQVSVAGAFIHQRSRCPHRRAVPTLWPQRN